MSAGVTRAVPRTAFLAGPSGYFKKTDAWPQKAPFQAQNVGAPTKLKI